MTKWPVLTTYDQDHVAKIALPLGGIGTGTVSLGGRGDLRDWEVMNRPAKSYNPTLIPGITTTTAFFSLYAKPDGGKSIARALEGPLPFYEYEGASGSISRNAGLPRFSECSFEAAYPFGQVHLSDPTVPLDVTIQGYNPLIPGDSDASGIPVAVLRYVLTNKTRKAVSASICANIPNFIGADGSAGAPSKNSNEFRPAKGKDKFQGIFMSSAGVAPDSEQWGTMAIATTTLKGATYRTAWADKSWGDTLLDFWDDFGDDGKLENRSSASDAPPASLAVSIRIPAKATQEIIFILAWHFPNRQSWTPLPQEEKSADCACASGCCAPKANPNNIGNYYCTQYTDAWDVLRKTVPQLPKLEERTFRFVNAFIDSDIEQVVKEAALYNVSTLRSQTVFRTADGRVYGWEGTCDKVGCCFGSCTHVWNYEQATGFLFGDLSRSMREVEFAHMVQESGAMFFRIELPIDRPQQGFKLAAADGQMGSLMRLYRDWQLSGDDAMLRALWPNARKAIEFCWTPGGWDGDQDGVMEGCQHNTMDVEYYGPNPQMSIWYLGALRACEEMAKATSEADFAAKCRALFESGRAWIDANLFNGEYYEHEIRPMKAADIAQYTRHESMGSQDLDNPDLQLGSGCLVDQLVGQMLAHVCGLGYLTKSANVKKTLRSIMKYNFTPSLTDHFNHLRTFALQEESALLMASYPKGRRPTRPFPYFNEVMTGFEYTAAVGMLYEGIASDGLRAIYAIRDRYDGRKRSPFDEAECGHHYARAMASWGAVLALTGFHYSAPEKTIAFAPNEGKFFWSNGSAWGTCAIRKQAKGMKMELEVMEGNLMLKKIILTGAGWSELTRTQTLKAGEKIIVVM